MLTVAAVDAAKPKEKTYRLSDERGMYLEVTPQGNRYWRLAYRFEGRQKTLALGVYPDVPLKLARERREEARKLIARKVDPAAERRAEKATRADTLEAIAAELFEKAAKEGTSAGTIQRDRDRLAKYVFPTLGRRPIGSITAPELLTCLRRIEARGTLETASRTRGVFGRIARYAIATGRAEQDIAHALRGAIATPRKRHHASITEPARIGELLRAIEGYQGQPSVIYALRLAPLVFVRPAELRGARWAEFDLDGDEPTWRIPGKRMKMREEHLVPLSPQAVAILRDAQALSGNGELCFPGLRSRSRPISNNTLNAALRRLGYDKDTMVGHGFRSMASTLLNEQGFHPDLIELQLAHAERNQVRASYNKAKRLPERRQMMAAWADYLDGLKAGGNVVPFRRQA